MSSDGYERVEAKLRTLLSEESFAHSWRTAATAQELARKHGQDIDLCSLAGLVHDVARDMNDVELLERARSLDLAVETVEQERPYLLHAAVGAGILTEKLGVEDDRVVRAVERHTFGAERMSDMEMIIFLADMIEPSRRFAGVDTLRALAAHDLRMAYLTGFKRQLLFVIEMGRLLHPKTLKAWNGIAKEVSERA